MADPADLVKPRRALPHSVPLRASATTIHGRRSESPEIFTDRSGLEATAVSLNRPINAFNSKEEKGPTSDGSFENADVPERVQSNQSSSKQENLAIQGIQDQEVRAFGKHQKSVGGGERSPSSKSQLEHSRDSLKLHERQDDLENEKRDTGIGDLQELGSGETIGPRRHWRRTKSLLCGLFNGS